MLADPTIEQQPADSHHPAVGDAADSECGCTAQSKKVIKFDALATGCWAGRIHFGLGVSWNFVFATLTWKIYEYDSILSSWLLPNLLYLYPHLLCAPSSSSMDHDDGGGSTGSSGSSTLSYLMVQICLVHMDYAKASFDVASKQAGDLWSVIKDVAVFLFCCHCHDNG